MSGSHSRRAMLLLGVSALLCCKPAQKDSDLDPELVDKHGWRLRDLRLVSPPLSIEDRVELAIYYNTHYREIGTFRYALSRVPFDKVATAMRTKLNQSRPDLYWAAAMATIRWSCEHGMEKLTPAQAADAEVLQGQLVARMKDERHRRGMRELMKCESSKWRFHDEVFHDEDGD
jgi:hypothetical protein